MKNHTSFHAVLKVALILATTSLVACGDDGTPADETTDAETTDDPTTTTTNTTTNTTTSPTTTTVSTTDTEATETVDPDSSGSESSTGGDPFIFPEEPYSDYTQIDRHGAVEAGTAGIAAASGLGLNGEDIAIRDLYNASNPAEDAAMMWVPEISDSVTFFHNELDFELNNLGPGFRPADVPLALAQAGPVIIPDTIKYDPANATAYPNGRTLEDQVVDITLAAVLLDLRPVADGGLGTPLSAFADLPLNPAENDVPFEAEFPYLAPPHNP